MSAPVPRDRCASDALDSLNYVRRQFADLWFYANDAMLEDGSAHGVDYDRARVAERASEILMSLNQIEDAVLKLQEADT